MNIKHSLDLLNPTALKILRLFFRFDQQFTGRKISTFCGLNNKTCNDYLIELVNNDILNRVGVGKAYLYTVNKTRIWNELIVPVLELEEKTYSKFCNRIKRVFTPFSTDIIVFGSYARDTQSSDSDFDLCLMVKKNSKALKETSDAFSAQALEDYNLVVSVHAIEYKKSSKLTYKTLLKNIKKSGQWLAGNKREFETWLRK